MHLRRFVLGLSATSIAVAFACSSEPAADDIGAGDAGAGSDAAPAPTSTTSPPDAMPPDAAVPLAVTFSYRPSWKGVKSVAVVGAFGLTTDWKQPLVTLVDDGTGTFTGSVPTLANGHYTYLFQVVGDDAAGAAKAATFPRFALDPTEAAFVACPTAAPTYSDQAANPCSDLTVPRGAKPVMFHVRGVVRAHGAPIADYLVEIERDETTSHHTFADRTTTLANGAFDLLVAQGTYRLQVLHPTFYSKTDVQRATPETYAAVRRSVSSPFLVDMDQQLNAAEISYDGYAAMTPRGSATLPTTFTFAAPPMGAEVHAAIYPPRTTVADPVWVAPSGTETSDVFDGGFNTKHGDGGPVPDASYLWGTESSYPAPKAGGVSWTAQSMVYPVKW